jgi:hypothetical protein
MALEPGGCPRCVREGAFGYDLVMDYRHDPSIRGFMAMLKEQGECPFQAIGPGALYGAIEALGELVDP